MGVILNPRGAAGSGKTELARRIMADYGWPGGGPGVADALRRPRRERPLAYRLRHPRGRRPLAVLGHYEATSGGCDTIRAVDGGMDEVFRLAAEHAAAGCDVLLEGLRLSAEWRRSAALAGAHRFHVLRLRTPLERCARNLAVWRRARRDVRPAIERAVRLDDAGIEAACRHLRGRARVEEADFDAALARARELLGLA